MVIAAVVDFAQMLPWVVTAVRDWQQSMFHVVLKHATNMNGAVFSILSVPELAVVVKPMLTECALSKVQIDRLKIVIVMESHLLPIRVIRSNVSKKPNMNGVTINSLNVRAAVAEEINMERANVSSREQPDKWMINFALVAPFTDVNVTNTLAILLAPKLKLPQVPNVDLSQRR